MLKIYNTLSKTKEIFKPIIPKKVRMYVCGMTVYDECHIGHGRMFVAFDMISRYLRSQDYDVTYIRNITDIDDKIINRANENSESIQSLTERHIEKLHQDDKALINLPPDQEPRATHHIPQIIELIQQLIQNESAYVAENGDVYFDVTCFNDYGKLAHQDLDQLQSGVRIDVLDVKKNSMDFVLWKLSKPEEPEWDSPWGKGRPGWHIECSAMSSHLLGQPFDIHGGGVDLVFPHHQNEVAQSEAALGKPFVNYWIHNGHVQIDREKMSKSLGNFFTISDVLKQYDGEVIRYFMLASHYRSPINYSKDNLESAYKALERFYTALRDLPSVEEKNIEDFEEAFIKAMNDDFNTPVAFSVLFDLARDINRLRDEKNLQEAAEKAAGLKRLASIFGLLEKNPNTFLKGNIESVDVEKIEQLINARNEARETKNWAQADRLRDELTSLGISIEDTAEGTIWRHSI